MLEIHRYYHVVDNSYNRLFQRLFGLNRSGNRSSVIEQDEIEQIRQDQIRQAIVSQLAGAYTYDSGMPNLQEL